MGAATSSPSLDRATLHELASLMDEAFPDLIYAFVADAGKIVAALQQSLSDDDLQAASQLAHTLKGSSANVGAAKLSDLCMSLNEAQRENAAFDFPESVAQIKVEFESVREQLDQFLKEVAQ